MRFQHPIWLAQPEKKILDWKTCIFILPRLSISINRSKLFISHSDFDLCMSETMLFLVSYSSKSSFSSVGNSYLGMDGARPEPGLVGVEDGGDVLQLPLRQLPVVGQQHRGGALHWRRSWTLQAGGILVKCF